ncbi:MAG TPA: hypothetical protein PLU37_01045 [Chitinophagaceae bacterium]|nr:hypothetical protein [Chitinophagaceae bacterium]HRX94961.1 hypothetical protein [Chitinophagaceae bacterium]
MKLKLYTIIFLGFGTILLSCASAKKLYEKGNYDEAVEKAAKKLQKDPHDVKLQDLILDAYAFAVKDHEDRIQNYSLSNNELKWEWMYHEYADLQKLYDAIFNAPDVFDLVKPIDYSSHIIVNREKAAAVRFDRGIAFMQHYDKESYRNAYREFKYALQLDPGKVEAAQMKEEAYEYAVTNIALIPLQPYNNFAFSSFNSGYDDMDQRMIRNLQYNSGNEFVRFYSMSEARNLNIRIDMVANMRITSMDIGRSRETNSIRKVSKEVVIKETVIKPDSVVKKYGKVHADVITTTRTFYSDASLQLNFLDDNGRLLWSEQFPAEHRWSTQFSSFRGDERALNDADLALINKRKEFPPSQNEITQILLDRMYNNVASRLRNYASRY